MRKPSAVKSFRGQIAICIAVIVIGILCFVIGGVMASKQNKYLDTKATIVSITTSGSGDDVSYTVLVDYTVDGKKYSKVSLDTYMSSYYEGKEIDIKYNPDDPSKITASTAITTVIPFVLGVILIIFGVVTILGTIRHEKKRKAKAEDIKNVTSEDDTKTQPQKKMEPVGKTADGKYSPFLKVSEDTPISNEKTVIESELEKSEKPYEGFSGTTEDNKYMKYSGVYRVNEDDSYKTSNDPNSIYSSEIGNDPYKK